MPELDNNLVNSYYNDVMFDFNTLSNKIGFLNVGYWDRLSSDSVEMAQINLIETLCRFLTNADGSVLDVACGKGASTKYLTKYFDPRRIIGINISELQLQACRATASECTFALMDATAMEFPDAQFDNILCIEAAFHFMTRYRFFQEAYRVLARGGRLAMSDILFGPSAERQFPSVFKENYVPTLEEYKQRILEAGFSYVRVQDTTQFATDAFFDHIVRRFEAKPEDEYRRRDYALMQKFSAAEPTCCMVYAVK